MVTSFKVKNSFPISFTIYWILKSFSPPPPPGHCKGLSTVTIQITIQLKSIMLADLIAEISFNLEHLCHGTYWNNCSWKDHLASGGLLHWLLPCLTGSESGLAVRCCDFMFYLKCWPWLCSGTNCKIHSNFGDYEKWEILTFRIIEI